MFLPNSFIDALSDYEAARYVIFGVPFDNTSSYRAGSRWAPDAMRQASANFESYNPVFDIDLVDLPIHDAGNLETSASVDETLRDLYEAAKELLDDGKLPIMLGGEHSLTFATVKACAELAGDDFGVLVLDAHFDLRDGYRGLKNNHACVSRNILSEITKNLVSIGIRSGPEEEWVFARENKLKYYTADDVEAIGIVEVLKEALEWLDCSQLYLSLDMDAIDPAYAPGLGTPEPFGLSARDVRTAVRTLAPFSMAFDIMEIAPEYDSGQTAMLGAKIMREFIASHATAHRND
ncbi:agmatinase [Methanosarcina sp. KYL-1]|uniref:agmatinase n=1 Tax=Methanosarcina sp. KYL-1 TaxID=2602068 RepID=UPI0021013BA8|nr:agmatinase [Methanosarcina sp. KYL-1]MCQ1534228.1 agmatinase [Methanosarcina sp. KYL-1]